uniref:ETS domain-containing protein n=1 Tax=Glossina pallidipes TaxID=7398 RepID=A0A1A9ZKA9_GLOPL
MKMLPVQLSLNPPLGLWSDMLWRCPPAPPSQLAELKTQLPPSLPSDPRLWSREDVAVFLHFCEREFDLPKVDYDLFQMNGKALCLLTRADFGHRCPGAGDVLHNVLQMLVIESHMMQWHLPNSPVTPTSRYPLSPHSHPPTPTWPPIAPPEKTSQGNSALANFSAHTYSTGHYNSSPPATPPVKREFFPDKNDNRYLQPVKREFFPETAEPNTNGRLLWDFLQQLLNDRNQKYSDLIAWKCRDTGVFKIVDPAGLAKLWGIQKNHLSMNYDKMSRALRYYYRVNILRKVQGERHCYQFLRNPTELKNIKNISLLRQTVASTNVGGSNGTNNSNSNGTNNQTSSSNMNTAASNNGTTWAMPSQGSLQHSINNTQQQNSNQRAASQGNQHLSLPNGISSAAAAVAAAYGPPPSSPLFMHAIHYLSSNGGMLPNSPVTLPNTPNDKFQFNVLKSAEQNPTPSQDSSSSCEEMKPTDLSVSANNGNNNSGNHNNNCTSEKRPYSSPSAQDDCYPLIRNADGLTTIKLIRYNETETSAQLDTTDSQQRQTPTPMESEASGCSIDSSPGCDNGGPTDLRK